MHKFFLKPEDISLEEASIRGEDVKHIYKVLRLEIGEKIIINNENGCEYLGVISSIDKTLVKVKILEKLDINNESPVEIYLFQGLPKATKMDLIVQKNTELGIKEITPILTSRVDVKLKGEFKKIDRLQRIALEASKQSKRTLIPKIREPISLTEVIDSLPRFDLVIVPYEDETEVTIKQMVISLDKSNIKTVAIIIGPEGGFEREEIEMLKKVGAKIITLGPRILRTETAGFTATTLVQYELGDLGGVN
ncbi:16S rRNA (uracil(1498)-N(3))-methyltransferase [Clostridium algidicarnis]|uniref:Ribosomal RNA small subunit methyltransferase E n=2 Tax=Clostridium algidicarnis TaxID=37659 RepID=A0A2S6G0U9_9CLOT|nr:16S rRNA (uracil(1498)-N(3))-methyltransferase [Clostridium algidicarnis]MBB6630498.1 16S rRNA (uracil(1498)-N(3))-methyltransferase [Clostridium algidicarnis]MBU3193584.1 16S rRNA (uracil(1498)-N(3))-methyltransferase [Clostridium algidicarnis]MBU3218599.1 16S rRNA (uracil(1498)-N(3))-methyltransferase [Clostridium algidicarnis]MCB2286496.1 16S rRNA (uracil(1498)-N(3))-methyltransferase [Clostridium algidicarnis]PPK49547.1 16S rRNA (uracil1498-N3)-methyltransferase [Clostridium algidicarni